MRGLSLGLGLSGVGAGGYNPSLPVWSVAIEDLLAGVSNARVLNIGDSTTIGIDAAGNWTDPNEYKWAASIMDAYVPNANQDAFFGFSTNGGSRIAKDPRIVNTGGAISSVGCLGGLACRLDTASDNIVFTPLSIVDTFRVYWWYNGSVAVSIQATGGTSFATTLSSTSGTQFGTTDIRYVDISAASLTAGNSVTITKTGGAGNFEVIGIEASDSTSKKLQFTNCGHWGSKSSDWATTTGAGRVPSDFLAKVPAGYYQLATIKAGINDANASVSIATFKTNIQTVINACKAGGMDVILESDNPISAGTTPPYIAALGELARTNNLFFINHHDDVFIDYTNANAQGWMTDSLHPSASGFEQQAIPLTELLVTQGVTPNIAPLYSRIVFYGDGTMSHAAAGGLRNAPTHTMMLLNGRVRPAVGWLQCASGGDMDTIYARRNQAIKQQPEIFVFASQGHNDALISSGYAAQMVKWERNLDACIAGLNSSTKIIVCTTIKSNEGAETSGGDWQTTVNTAQKAAIAARQAIYGSRIILCDTYAAYNDPANMSPSSDADKVHPDERGGYAIGLAMFNTIDAILATETKANILADIAAKSWRSANIHPDNTFSGTGGTKSGTNTPTGSWPTGQRITNNLTNGTSVAVACTTPDSATAQAVLTGTPASESSIVMDDTASITLTGLVKGAFYEWREGVYIDDGANGAAGIDNLAIVLGSFGTVGSTASGAAVHSAPYSRKIDTVLSVVGCSFGATQPPAVNPSIQTRYRAAAANSRIQISKPALFQVEKEAYAPMFYVGDDGIFTSNFQYRVTGTGVSGSNITAATVATLTMEAGVWAGGNADWDNAFTRVMKINGTVVSGAFGSGWTYNATGTLTAGQTVTFEITGTNSLGSDTRTLTFTVI